MNADSKGILLAVDLTPDSDGLIVPSIVDGYHRTVDLPEALRRIIQNSWIVGGWTQNRKSLARRLGISHRTLDGLMCGRACSLEVWFRFQAFCDKLGESIGSGKPSAPRKGKRL